MLIIQNKKVYAYWYEEIEIYETENIDSMWWLSKNKKEKLKKEQEDSIKREIEKNKSKEFRDKKFKWFYDNLGKENFPKNKWEIIDDNLDGIGYKYYFDKDGYLLIDTITPDYKIVDNKGREVDYNLRPIEYYFDDKEKSSKIEIEENNKNIIPTIEPPKVLIGEGVTLKKKEKIYNNSINKNVIDYVDTANRFINETKGIVYNEVIWKKCSSIKGNGGFVIFNNPQNNFNKITGYIATKYQPFDEVLNCTLKVYDADLYDKYDREHHLYDIEEIYKNSNFYNCEPIRFIFTFDRSIKRLRFEIETFENKNITCYFKDLKYGFSKNTFYEELIRKKEEEEEIEELKRLGIYVEDYFSFEALDEDGNIIEENDETEHENENNDDRIGGISYTFDEETRNYEDVIRDRTTGPYFDKSLEDGLTWRNSGPAFINIGTYSNIK